MCVRACLRTSQNACFANGKYRDAPVANLRAHVELYIQTMQHECLDNTVGRFRLQQVTNQAPTG